MINSADEDGSSRTVSDEPSFLHFRSFQIHFCQLQPDVGHPSKSSLLLWRLNLDDVDDIVIRIDVNDESNVLILHTLQRFWIVHGIALVVLVGGHGFSIVADFSGHVLVTVRTCLALIILTRLVSTLARALVLRPSHSRH
jgi:hypothetical protein